MFCVQVCFRGNDLPFMQIYTTEAALASIALPQEKLIRHSSITLTRLQNIMEWHMLL